MSQEICKCESTEPEGCMNCGMRFCGLYDENLAKYGNSMVGCGLQKYKCMVCGKGIK